MCEQNGFLVPKQYVMLDPEIDNLLQPKQIDFM